MFNNNDQELMINPDLLDDARRQLLLGHPLPENLLPDAVARSWQRSRDAGLHPWESRLVNRVNDDYPLSETDEHLAATAQPEIDRLWDVFGGEDWCLFCVNSDAVIVRSKTNAETPPLSMLKTGVRVQEADIGTTAPACTLREKRAFVFTGPQHYLKEFDHFFCVSVPVFGPDNQLAGALDMTGIGERNTQVVFEQLRLSAMAIENQLFTDHYAGCDIFSIQSSPTFLNTPFQGLVALSADGNFVAASHSARQLLQLRISSRSLPFNQSSLKNLGARTEKRALPDGTYIYVRNLAAGVTTFRHAQQQSYVPVSVSTEPAIEKQFGIAVKACKADIPIMITGETGTGKEVFAKALHDTIDADSPFIAINCSAMPENLIESELFGYEEGSFTGAKKGGARGKLEDADGGTLLLDEIGDMPLRLQTRLLRFLQERQITRIGSSMIRPLSIRIICATHRDLPAMVAKQMFREDLYYRLKGMQVKLPPLHLRQDLRRLITTIVASFNHTEITEDAMQWLINQPWPGNIRQLRQTIHLATVIADGKKALRPEHFVEFDAQPQEVEPLTLADIEKNAIEAAVQRHHGNLTAAARELGISRTTLYKKREN